MRRSGAVSGGRNGGFSKVFRRSGCVAVFSTIRRDFRARCARIPRVCASRARSRRRTPTLVKPCKTMAWPTKIEVRACSCSAQTRAKNASTRSGDSVWTQIGVALGRAKNRRKFARESLRLARARGSWRSTRRKGIQSALGRASDALWTRPGALLGALGAPRGVPRALLGRFWRVPGASRRVPERRGSHVAMFPAAKLPI